MERDGKGRFVRATLREVPSEELWPAADHGRYPANLLGQPETAEEAPVGEVWTLPDEPTWPTETGGGDNVPPPGEEGEGLPERNWLLIAVAVLAIVVGVRAIYVGVRVLRDENVLPGWATGGF